MEQKGETEVPQVNANLGALLSKCMTTISIIKVILPFLPFQRNQFVPTMDPTSEKAF